MQVETIKNRPIDSNCYVLYTDKGNNCIILDPGTEDCSELLQYLSSNELNPTHIILTHEHFDHIWGVNKLLDIYKSNLVCSERCLEAIQNKKKNLSLFYDNVGFDVAVTKPSLISNEILFDSEIIIKILETPGHSPGSISVLIKDYLFTGDTLLMKSKIVTKLPGGSKIQLYESLDKLYTLFRNQNITIYPGHGDPFGFDNLDLNLINE
jgi:glyoxylase-like metal-dependent hydrolase (beta-lactamase superfamily II)